MSVKTVAICEDHFYNEMGKGEPVVLSIVTDECYLPGCHEPANIFVQREMQDIVYVRCMTCIMCGKSELVAMYKDEYDKWIGGMNIQEAAPELPVGDRELLITGTHEKCFEKMTGKGN